MTKANGNARRWIEVDEYLRIQIPHVSGWWNNENRFRGLSAYTRDDKTVLLVAKSYDSKGKPVVAFGSGYDVVLAFIALDSSIQGNHWKPEKSYADRNK